LLRGSDMHTKVGLLLVDVSNLDRMLFLPPVTPVSSYTKYKYNNRTRNKRKIKNKLKTTVKNKNKTHQNAS